jgi:methionyl-tRNA formyltransferase
MTVYNWIRGQTHPYPGAFSFLDGRKVTIRAARPPTGEAVFGLPGSIDYREGDALGIHAWEGIPEVTRLQVGDDEEIPAGTLLERYDVSVGDRFENPRGHAASS